MTNKANEKPTRTITAYYGGITGGPTDEGEQLRIYEQGGHVQFSIADQHGVIVRDKAKLDAGQSEITFDAITEWYYVKFKEASV